LGKLRIDHKINLLGLQYCLRRFASNFVR
jgi:hypothetical protein